MKTFLRTAYATIFLISVTLLLGYSTSTYAGQNQPVPSKITPYERGLIYGLAPLEDMLNADNFDFHLHGFEPWKELPWKVRIRTANFYADKVLAYLGDSQDIELRSMARSIAHFLKTYENRVHHLQKEFERIEKHQNSERNVIQSFINVEMQANPKSHMLISYQDMLHALDLEKQSEDANYLRSQKDLEQHFHEELNKIKNLKTIAGRWKKNDNSDSGFLSGLTEGLQVHLLMLDSVSINRGNYFDNIQVGKIRNAIIRKVGLDFIQLLSVLPPFDRYSQAKPLNDMKPIALKILALTDQTMGTTYHSSVFNRSGQIDILRELRTQLIELNKKYTPAPSCGGLF
jgi:hypothetical protein